MRIGIYTNIQKDTELKVTKSLADRLTDGGMDVAFYGAAAKSLGCQDGFSAEQKPEVMLALGGDGTILRIASFAAEHAIPILGFNLGTLGFLTGFEKDDADQLIAVLKNRDYHTEKRTMLRVRFGGVETLALNEVVLSRASGGKMVSLDAFVNGEFVDRYFCDGLIVATPTGSTAYSLSAGGSIISPSADAFALTPVNPHSLHARPMIIGGGDTITVRPVGETQECAVVVDGREVGAVKRGESIGIHKSAQSAIFLKTNRESFFTRLLAKLNSWSVTNRSEE